MLVPPKLAMISLQNARHPKALQIAVDKFRETLRTRCTAWQHMPSPRGHWDKFCSPALPLQGLRPCAGTSPLRSPRANSRHQLRRHCQHVGEEVSPDVGYQVPPHSNHEPQIATVVRGINKNEQTLHLCGLPIKGFATCTAPEKAGTWHFGLHMVAPTSHILMGT